MKTPILFIIFNRPDVTEKVFNAIKKQKPKKLYIAADGPRSHKPGEDLICEETRRVVSIIDWECEVKTLFRDCNLGCGKAVSGAIDWFFENEEMGIILEDDCLPNEDFYQYCELLLEIFKYSNEVFTITGDNFFSDKMNSNQVMFSKYTHIWGWATWRRVWKHYTFNLQINEEDKNILKTRLTRGEYNHWMSLFDKIQRNEVDTWDYQLQYMCFRHGGLTAVPPKNLVQNIGFDERATHTQSGSWLSINANHIDINDNLVTSKILENKKLSKLIWTKMHRRKTILERVVYRLTGIRV